MDLVLLNNISSCGHRFIKLLGNGLIVFIFSMLIYLLFSPLGLLT